ncbi:AAA family ATPase [Mahella australiensis]|uniref:AAA ATPase central domain protein n=1 Tax=Mahella australiensis (strain DSM 15567 / CIP 107919 / 50-1 BON) TaxID=697281 RepID=F3ZXC6_MAHA5|nr:AAA family ATPase [Mahella australiensis]AEE96583.1 AAA ATPase central domain protein [Mahella australiensis 50-1 BON]
MVTRRLSDNELLIIQKVERREITPSDAIRYIYGREQYTYDINSLEIAEAKKELFSLIGLENIKKLVEELQAYINIQQRRKMEGMAHDAMTLHMIFKGNPGTGKTIVARLLGKMLHGMGILRVGHIIEVERADLVGEYIGHTAQKVREQVKKASGGVLFIDEAYSLARGGERDFGKEAIDTLVKEMEDNKDDLIVILAGYKDEMDYFIRMNPGLRSRFPIQMEFKDYTLDELVQIAELMFAKRQYSLSLDGRNKLYLLLAKKRSNDDQRLGNARLVRNLVENAIRKQAVRLHKQSRISKNDLIIIRKEDIEEVDMWS